MNGILETKLDRRLELEKLAKDLGASLFGVAGLDKLRDKIDKEAKMLAEGLPLAISLGIGLSSQVIESLEDRPTLLYLHHYRQLNILLDQIALKLSLFIQKEGFNSLPIPASQIIDWERQRGHLSHKLVARYAGLGWIGKNNLLINPHFGARVRLVTLLTNFHLSEDEPLEIGCGDCRNCLPICPAGAIKDSPEDFDHIGCYEKLKSFRNRYNIGHYICGLCVKACQREK